MQKDNIDSFDLLKFICSILIVFLHINPFPSDGIFRPYSRAIASIGVPCFFIISGFLFFDGKENETKLRKYVLHIIKMLSFWIIPYFIIMDCSWILKGNILFNLLQYIKNILFGGSGFYLWYLVSQIFGMIFCYYVTNKYNEKNSQTIAFVFLLLGILCTSYSYLLPSYFKKIYDLTVSLINTYRNGLFFGFPLIYIGKMLNKNKYKINSKIKSLLLTVLSFILLIIENRVLIIFGYSMSVMNISTMFLSVSIVCLFYSCRNIQISKAYYLRKLSFLNYVFHPIYIYLVPKILRNLNGVLEYYWYYLYYLQIPFIITITMFSGLIFIKLSKRCHLLLEVM